MGRVYKHLPLIIVLMMGVFLALLNQTLLNVAIPHLIHEFHVTASTAQWLLTGYMLVNGILIPLTAYLVDRFGTRQLFLASMIFFTAGSLVCGIAPSFSVMLTGRLVQAMGAGILMPLVMVITLYIFPPEARGKGMGIFGLGMIFAPAVGPTLAGWVIENYDWRILFHAMVPLGVIVTIVAFFLLKNTLQKETKPAFDFWGAITSSLGVGLLLYGLSEAGNKEWSDPVVVAALSLGVFFISLFVVLQHRSRNPMLNFDVFKYDMFTLSCIINVIVTVAMFSGMFLLPIYLQNLRGFTAFESGLLLMPGAIIMGIMSPVSGILFDKVGPRPLATAGLLITTITTYEFTHLTLETSYAYILMIYMIRSFGMSLMMMPIMTAGLNQLPSEMNSHGTAMANTTRQIAGSLGISVFTTIFAMRAQYHLGKFSEQANLMDPAYSDHFHAYSGFFAQSLGLPQEHAQGLLTDALYGQASQYASVMGINDAFVWATLFAFVGLVLSFFMRDVRKDNILSRSLAKKRKKLEPIKGEI
ncbi:DHA2 family efflux MFS transporter permease subunit [Thermoactinomyces mirandus]|uniref:DHA2 family efflux MFS transporter permease subunit n=1 Tax=Thermoactinomyces mirandus TaxID=2756294 RepID=A0A7W1XRL0_9BACL|nr:DHA2 family efflux MFS transporter permease subunit [Thermoactinomyces mirandus]MBA4602023.1 DHA2 family efflux MFS transporter permease subunit [Thermoactinomyces mirandus]